MVASLKQGGGRIWSWKLRADIWQNYIQTKSRRNRLTNTCFIWILNFLNCHHFQIRWSLKLNVALYWAFGKDETVQRTLLRSLSDLFATKFHLNRFIIADAIAWQKNRYMYIHICFCVCRFFIYIYIFRGIVIC